MKPYKVVLVLDISQSHISDPTSDGILVYPGTTNKLEIRHFSIKLKFLYTSHDRGIVSLI